MNAKRTKPEKRTMLLLLLFCCFSYYHCYHHFEYHCWWERWWELHVFYSAAGSGLPTVNSQSKKGSTFIDPFQSIPKAFKNSIWSSHPAARVVKGEFRTSRGATGSNTGCNRWFGRSCDLDYVHAYIIQITCSG